MSKTNYQKSAKDIAFDKERARFRKQIKELEKQIGVEKRQLEAYEETIRQKDDAIRQKDEWISRLLEYMDLSEEELKKFIEAEKKKTEIVEHLHDMNSVFGRFGLFGGY